VCLDQPLASHSQCSRIGVSCYEFFEKNPLTAEVQRAQRQRGG
jgi:hypothetical protein